MPVVAVTCTFVAAFTLTTFDDSRLAVPPVAVSVTGPDCEASDIALPEPVVDTEICVPAFNATAEVDSTLRVAADVRDTEPVELCTAAAAAAD